MWVVELAAQVEAVAVAQVAAVALVEQAVTLAVQVAAVEAQVARDPLLEERAEQHPLQKILVAEVEEPRLILHLAVVVTLVFFIHDVSFLKQHVLESTKVRSQPTKK